MTDHTASGFSPAHIRAARIKPVRVKDGALKASKAGRGPTTRHARIRASERLQHPMTQQRQVDILNRLRKGSGLSLSDGRRDQGRWYLEDSGEPLVIVTNRAMTAIVTIWPLTPGTRAARMVDAKLAPIREAKRLEAEKARIRAEEAARLREEQQHQAKRAELRSLMGPVSVPKSLAKAREAKRATREDGLGR